MVPWRAETREVFSTVYAAYAVWSLEELNSAYGRDYGRAYGEAALPCVCIMDRVTECAAEGAVTCECQGMYVIYSVNALT